MCEKIKFFEKFPKKNRFFFATFFENFWVLFGKFFKSKFSKKSRFFRKKFEIFYFKNLPNKLQKIFEKSGEKNRFWGESFQKK